MSASSTTSTTDDNRSEHEELMFSKNSVGASAKTPMLMTTSRSDYGVSEYSTTSGLNGNAHRTLGAMVSTSTISTLDRSAYQSLPLSGTRRITVQFGDIKIVVPWKESASATVGDLANAALLRYKRACGNNSVKIVRFECASDGGILDWDDVLEDVFDLAFDQILAITDDSTPQHHYAQPFPVNRRDLIPVASAYGSVSVQNPISYTSTSNSTSASSSSHKSRRDSIIEVKNLESPISPGLRVHKTPTGIRTNMEDLRISTEMEPILRSSLRNNQENVKKMQQARVTLSPEVEKKLAEREKPRYEKNTSANRLLRSSDRKSRINDAFLDSRDRLVEKMGEKEKETQKGPVLEGPMAGTTIVTFLPPENDQDSEIVPEMGLEVNAVYDEATSTPSTSANSQNQKLTAVQIMKIEKNGRIGKDGRLKVGDSIVEIDGRPVYQMSILRARAYIADLAVSTKPVTLTILRSIETFSDENNIDQKPIFSALQAANTQYIGQTQIVELVKSSNGFGFTVTGRETAKGERLFYIGTVKPYGVALGHLKSGDRLLEINGESTGNLSQLEIVDRLKQAMVGEKVKFLVSRVPAPSENKENVENPETPAENVKAGEEIAPEIPENERFELIIPLNDTGSAGLGVSLKARVSVKSDGARNDCGIFIKNVMHGGAAFKDGRLKINDRIVGIEDIELESLTNSAASESLTRKLKSIRPSMSHVKLSIIREPSKKPGPISRDSSRITATSPSISSSMLSPITVSSESQHSRQSSKEDETILENPTDDPFDREAPGRKSLSEKRGIGAATGDPQHIKLFQEIKHQRQNSAPPASTSRSAAAKRSKSQPRSFSQRNYQRKAEEAAENIPEPPSASTLPREKPIDAERSGILNRRSLSMESIVNPSTSSPAAPTFSSIPNSESSSSSTPGGHPFPPGASPLLRRKNNEEKLRQSDKSRRKSVGNAMRNFFGFGNSKSRDASPEKQPASFNEIKIKQPVFMDHGEPYQQPGSSNFEYGSEFAASSPSASASADAQFYSRYAQHRYPPDAENAFYWRPNGVIGSPSSQNRQNSTYVNYGLPTSNSYHVMPPTGSAGDFNQGGSYSAASLRRAYAEPYFEDDYQQIHIEGPPQPRNYPQKSAATNYHNAFNTWFAYTGGGAVGAAPMLFNGNARGSPVRIAAASTIRDAAYAERASASAAAGRGSRNCDAPEKYADVTRAKPTAAISASQAQNHGGSSRFFIPRHGGGISAATFSAASSASGRHASGSPQQFRRRGSASGEQHRRQSPQKSAAATSPAYRFPQY